MSWLSPPDIAALKRALWALRVYAQDRDSWHKEPTDGCLEVLAKIIAAAEAA